MLFSELIQCAKEAKISFEYTLPTHLLGKEKEISFNQAWTDSRRVEKNDLFICTQGEKTDGHKYAEQTVESGASILIVEKEKFKNNALNFSVPLIYVENSVEALMKIALAKRMKFQGKVIGITGTAGKTTVKELLAQVLSCKGKTAKNYLNFNTQIGLSLSILNTSGDENFWVLEAGISHEHDMDEIATVLRPDIALILNADLGHAEGLPKGSAYYKSKLFKYLKDEHSKALACADYSDLVKESQKNTDKIYYFTSQDKKVEYQAKYKGALNENPKNIKGLYTLSFSDLSTGEQEIFDVETPLHSEYGAENVIAISAIASLCGMNEKEIQEAFKKSTLPSQRFEIHYYNNITLIDDSYNANPLSFKRMLQAAQEYTSEKKIFICIAGAMGELGEHAKQAHLELGKELANTRAKYIFYTGDFSKEIKQGLEENSFESEFNLLKSPEDFSEYLKKLALSEATFLVKGSRSNHLELYVQEIQKLYGQEYAL